MNSSNRAHVGLRRRSPANRSRSVQPFMSLACGGWLLAVSAGLPALAEGLGGISELGPTPTGLAATAFLNPLPAQPLAGLPSRDTAAATVKPPVSWRPRSPVERLLPEPGNIDPFPHTRRAVPLLVPDVIEVTSQRPLPARAMRGPSVGVPWRIPGSTP
ncbi:MAG: hypothetical protein RLZZ21_2886 [Planctomycetota bacterium]